MQLNNSIAQNGLILLGCGRMGAALLKGWLRAGIPANSVFVVDPTPPEWVEAAGCLVNSLELPPAPAVIVFAVKPQVAEQALESLAPLLPLKSTLGLSIVAGLGLHWFEARLSAMPIVRAMPNTPAAIGAGITALIGGSGAQVTHLDSAEELMSAVGSVVRLESEAQMDAVTALSGSGPAYVFHLIEVMTAAGCREGLPENLALELALQTIAGAGALASAAGVSPGELREDVTSPGGTTAAGLSVLMDREKGLAPLMARTIRAARLRSEELADG